MNSVKNGEQEYCRNLKRPEIIVFSMIFWIVNYKYLMLLA